MDKILNTFLFRSYFSRFTLDNAKQFYSASSCINLNHFACQWKTSGTETSSYQLVFNCLTFRKLCKLIFFCTFPFTDIRECNFQANSYPCHVRANCIELYGSYRCECINGYTGDGKNCVGNYFFYA